MLEVKEDHYGGVYISSKSLKKDPIENGELLAALLEELEKKNTKGVWLKIPIERSDTIPIAVSLGFVFHHAKPEYVMLNKWLPKDRPNSLPTFAFTSLGVAGFVVNDKNEVLVIQEKNGPITGYWKLPGGSSDPGEEIFETAIREVKEETGIDTEFERLITFRHHHTDKFGTSNLYFVCKLKPKNFDIIIQESEIADAKWMSLEEFDNIPRLKGLYKKLNSICVESVDQKDLGLNFESLPL